MKRRHFLTISASTIGGVLVYSLDRIPTVVAVEQKALQIPLHFFDETEARIVAAAASRIFPSDDSGPGASEAGVVIYIDRQLAGPYGQGRYRYMQPPFEEAPPDFGYQGKASPAETYREGLGKLPGFDQLATAAQDAALKKIESTRFFSLLLQHTIEGMFCDPMHGGNRNMLGWQLIGFPGPRFSNREDVDAHFGEAFRPKPASLKGGDASEGKK